MAIEEGVFKTRIEFVEGYEFNVRFAEEGMPELTMDEPEPLGSGKYPNAGMVLAAAVGNCLCASLAFCLRKSHADVKGVEAEVYTSLERNERDRLRIASMRVELRPDTDDRGKLERCRGIFEDFCIVTESVREGIPIEVAVVPPDASSRNG